MQQQKTYVIKAQYGGQVATGIVADVNVLELTAV